MNENNLENFLDYYIRLNAPGYAVLITGEWGAGKTYQTLQFIPKEMQCHISLFGISNTSEIYNNVFAKMYPGKNLAKKVVNVTKDVTSEIQGVTFGAGAVIGNLLGAVIKQQVDKSKVIIFDDLERCPLKNEEILGVINQYVEHHQCRVIIIAHDKKIHDDFVQSKEKVIGHTIRITPKIDEAGTYFFQKKYRLNKFNSIKPVILNAFKKTECQSLRILNYIINDCDRLLKCLEPKHIKNTEAMVLLFTNFAIIDTEFRQGNISFSDIENLQNHYFNYIASQTNKDLQSDRLDEHQKRMAVFFGKYNEFDIATSLINYNLLAKIVDSGDYPINEILQSINFSRFFIAGQKNRPWQIIINFDKMDDAIVNKAIEEAFDQLSHFKIIDLGDLLHTFHLFFMLSDKNAIPHRFDQLVALEKDYIDSLLKKGLLSPSPIIKNVLDEDIYERSHGHMYWSSDSYYSEIDEVIQYLKQKRDDAMLALYPTFADEILNALETNIDKFKHIIIGDSGEQGKYSQIDIFRIIPQEDFLIRWLMLPIEQWDKVRMILNIRYRNAAYNMLQNEKYWLYGLCVSLKLEANMQTGLGRSRIERLVPIAALKAF
ncbi:MULTISPECIES: hypothetical protein [Kosakonia]|uniref:hypothetical protein n=1 Tax=Kosakonia TaxID=1330547 RepID=UPI0005ED8D27|nr:MULTISPECIES: hypothetical protein [Kosakonia]RCW97060.1 hypothetical protein DFO56_1103 [Kosakonia sp. AG348]